VARGACYSYTGSDPARHVLGPLFKQLVGREPDEIVSGQGMTKSEQPDAHTVTLVPGTPKRLEEYSSHVDAETYDESLRARPGGVARIDPTKVVSPGPIARYAVLPEQAGLLQLLDTGALERLGPGRFRIIKPIERFPPGLSGARHVAFTLAPGIPMPEGDPGSSSVISEETGEILVDVATKRWKQALDPFADVRASEERF